MLFNDTREGKMLHAGSMRGACEESRVPPRAAATFDIPDDHDAFVKFWGSVILVRPFLDDHPKFPLPREVS